MKYKKLKYFLAAVVLLFLIYQLFSLTYKPVETKSAEYVEVVDGVKATGVIIRNETYVTGNKSGALHFVTTDGSRVAKGGTVATVYDSASTSYTVSRIDELNNRIADIEELQRYNNVSASDLGLADQKVTESLSAMIVGSRGGNISGGKSGSGNLLSAISRRQMITGEDTDFTAQHDALVASRDALAAQLPAATGAVSAPVSGYFLSHLDGYENILSGKNISEITPEFIKSLKPSDVPENTIGKIVSDYEWYVACTVSLSDSLKYKESDELSLSSSLKVGSEFPATVKAINISSNTDTAVVVLSCGTLSRELASMRSGTFTIVNKTYKGLKIPKKALRVVKKKTGVYIVSGASLKFVRVNVLYSMEDDIICEQEKSNDDVLRLYDEVVVKGNNIYDGKIVG